MMLKLCKIEGRMCSKWWVGHFCLWLQITWPLFSWDCINMHFNHIFLYTNFKSISSACSMLCRL